MPYIMYTIVKPASIKAILSKKEVSMRGADSTYPAAPSTLSSISAIATTKTISWSGNVLLQPSIGIRGLS